MVEGSGSGSRRAEEAYKLVDPVDPDSDPEPQPCFEEKQNPYPPHSEKDSREGKHQK
jgi:hypothetical protein